MTERPKKARAYPIVGGGEKQPPKYDRVVRALSDRDLRAELRTGRGSGEYQDALRAELRRRGL